MITPRKVFMTDDGKRILQYLEHFKWEHHKVINKLFNWPTKTQGPVENAPKLVKAGYKPATDDDNKLRLRNKDIRSGRGLAGPPWVIYAQNGELFDFAHCVARDYGFHEYPTIAEYNIEHLKRNQWWVKTNMPYYHVGMGLVFGYTFDAIIEFIDHHAQLAGESYGLFEDRTDRNPARVAR